MCTRYVSPEMGDLERHWQVSGRDAPAWPREIFPRLPGPFIRAVPGAAEPQHELVVGPWALVPWFAKTPKLPYLTCNARGEELAAKASYKQPWARGQRCIIPAAAFYEPCWESGRHVPWRFTRADGLPWGLAGLWNTWVDAATGEVVESYTMLTLNADAHPLMRRMHKPDPKFGVDQQDKRSVVPLAAADWQTWLHAPQAAAAALVKLAPEADFLATPEAWRSSALKQPGQPARSAPLPLPGADLFDEAPD